MKSQFLRVMFNRKCEPQICLLLSCSRVGDDFTIRINGACYSTEQATHG